MSNNSFNKNDKYDYYFFKVGQIFPVDVNIYEKNEELINVNKYLNDYKLFFSIFLVKLMKNRINII
jgi:hypothetical protein